MKKTEKKDILLISYHFPPSSEVGGLRIANFAKYLPLFGWNTYVLTIKDHYLKKVDIERLKEVGGVKIFKTAKLPKLIQAYLRLKIIYYSILKRKHVTLGEIERSYIRADVKLSGKEKVAQKIKRYLVSLFLAFPDTENNWILPAAFKGIRVIKHEKIDCILTSCPPYSVHLIGLLLKIIMGVRWVADFRDPWLISGPKRLYANCYLSNKIEGWLEKKVVQHADIVLTTTERLHKAFCELYKKEPVSKFLYISNGFDNEAFSRFNHLKKYGKFTLTYTGSLYLGRSPEPLFKALKELITEGRLRPQNINIKLIGNCQYVDGNPIAQIINSYNLSSTTEVLEPIPYYEALEIIKQSHLALLFAIDQPLQIPAKVYDYIGLGTPILALTEQGATWDLINSRGIGRAFYPSDIEGIKEFIYQSITNGESLEKENNSDILYNFDRKHIIQNFAQHLNSII